MLLKQISEIEVVHSFQSSLLLKNIGIMTTLFTEKEDLLKPIAWGEITRVNAKKVACLK